MSKHFSHLFGRIFVIIGFPMLWSSLFTWILHDRFCKVSFAVLKLWCSILALLLYLTSSSLLWWFHGVSYLNSWIQMGCSRERCHVSLSRRTCVRVGISYLEKNTHCAWCFQGWWTYEENWCGHIYSGAFVEITFSAILNILHNAI